MILTVLLAWLHILSAIAWLGGGIMFGLVISPALQRLTPGASAEFLIKIIPRATRFLQAAAGSKILFGLLLLYNLGGASLLDPSTAYGFELSLGVGFAVVAFVLAEFVTAPVQLRAVRIAKGMLESGGGPPPPELASTLRMVKATALVTLVLLLLTLWFMAGAGFY